MIEDSDPPGGDGLTDTHHGGDRLDDTHHGGDRLDDTHHGGDAVRLAVTACPVCEQPVEARFRPFCSKRCADIDLGRWMRGVYRVETDEPADERPVEETA